MVEPWGWISQGTHSCTVHYLSMELLLTKKKIMSAIYGLVLKVNKVDVVK